MQRNTKPKLLRLGVETKKGLYGYLFCLPFILGVVFIFGKAIVMSFLFGINDIALEQGGFSLEYVGFKYYNFALFEDADFLRSIIESIGNLVKDLIVIMVYSLFVAVLIYKQNRGKKIIQIIFFLPVIASTGIIQSIESNDLLTNTMLSQQHSDMVNISSESDMSLLLFLENLFESIELGSLTNIVFEAVNNIFAIVMRSGVQIIIFLTALQGISPSIYEAAYVEGCGEWEKFWKITFPLVSPMILVNTVWTVVDFFMNPTNKTMMKILEKFRAAQYGLSSAMAFTNFIIMGIFVAILLFFINKFVFYENRR